MKHFTLIKLFHSVQYVKLLASICIVLSYLTPLRAQHPEIKNLLFEGAGIRGIAYAGAIEELERSNILKGVERVGGTSAGAITALIISLGYSSKEMKEIIYNTNFKQFNDGKLSIAGGLHRMNKFYGWYQGKKFEKWLSQLIQAKTGNADCTFEELHQQGYKELYVTATCLNQQKVIVFSHLTYPNMKVKDAVRISMSIPLYFKSVWIDKEGRVLRKGEDTYHADLVIDGGMKANFPITIFDTIAVDSSGNKIRSANIHTLGIRIDSDTQIQLDKTSKELESFEINSFGDYLQASYVFMLESLNRESLTSADWKRSISVSSSNISPLLKKLSPAQKNQLIENGKKAMREYFGEK